MDWYPTPSYLLKRQVILEFIRKREIHSFLEVGCGSGDLLAELERLGLEGLGIDISSEAVALARKRIQGSRVEVRNQSVEDISNRFEMVIASEVLEHHVDDVGFLTLLSHRLCPGGWLLLTVPAHMAKWGANDVFCGHVRRYERLELQEKLMLAGFRESMVCSYGVPLYNIMKPLYDRAIRECPDHAPDDDARTLQSGCMHVATGMGWLFRLLFNNITLAPFYLLQRAFYSTDLGNGYFVAARRN